MIISERKRSQEKNYPKGYAEMLEQQQAQLVSALTEMYYQLRKASAWEGPSLDESEGHPSTHDILSALDLLEVDSKFNEVQVFEDECDKQQFRMNLDHASLLRRRLQVRASSEVTDSCQERSGTTTPDDRKSVHPKPSSPTQDFDRPSVFLQLLNQSATLSWEAPLQPPHEEAPVVNNSILQGSLAFGNERRLSVLEWEHALMKMNETYQAYCNEPKAFGAFGSLWESAPIHLDAHQDLLINENVCGMPHANDLFNLDWLPCDLSDFAWQPEMTTWAT